MKPKIHHALDIHSVKSLDGRETYTVLFTPDRRVHVLAEVEAKNAARKCGSTLENRSPYAMWREVIGR